MNVGRQEITLLRVQQTKRIQRKPQRAEIHGMPQPDHFRVRFLERPKPDEFSRTLVRRGARQQGLLAWTTERGNQLVGCKMLDRFNIDANWQLLRNRDDCNLVSVRYAEVHVWLTL